MDAQFQQIDFGPLRQFLDNDDVTDISYSNGGQVWIKTLSKGVYRVENTGIDNTLIGTLSNIKFKHNVPKYEDTMEADFSISEKDTFIKLFMDYKLFAENTQTVTKDNWKDFLGLTKPMLFDYAYCITCHKSQGSEFDKVLVFNEYMKSTDHKRWLYTAATRAKKKLIIVADA